MQNRLRFLVAAFVVALFAVTACTSTTAANSPSTNTSGTGANVQSTPGSVTPAGAVQMGTWRMTVHGAQAYPTQWNPPAGMPGMWGHMGAGSMAVVLDVSAQNTATPGPGAGTAYAGPRCALRGGWGMMGPMMGYGAYGWQMMAPGLYRGPMAYRVPTSTHQFTLVCANPATGSQASWNIGF